MVWHHFFKTENHYYPPESQTLSPKAGAGCMWAESRCEGRRSLSSAGLSQNRMAVVELFCSLRTCSRKPSSRATLQVYCFENDPQLALKADRRMMLSFKMLLTRLHLGHTAVPCLMLGPWQACEQAPAVTVVFQGSGPAMALTECTIGPAQKVI